MSHLVLFRLTQKEVKSMIAEINAWPWHRSHPASIYPNRATINLRKTLDLGPNKLPLTTAKFEYEDKMEKMPVTREVMQKAAATLDAGENEFGIAYASYMSEGDEVPTHTDSSPYYDLYHRVQVTLIQDETEFLMGGERVNTQVGDCTVFENAIPHSIKVVRGPRQVVLFDVRKMNGVLHV